MFWSSSRFTNAAEVSGQDTFFQLFERSKEIKGKVARDRQHKQSEADSQSFKRRLNIWEFEEDGPIRDIFIVEHKADSPDNRREADVLDAGQVVQNNLRLSVCGHFVLCGYDEISKKLKAFL
jgi:hypothetical protein